MCRGQVDSRGGYLKRGGGWNLFTNYEKKINSVLIRSRCDRYKHGEKSSTFFINLEKNRALQNQIRTISFSEKDITDEKVINTELFKFYEGLFEPKINVSNTLNQDHLNGIEILK